jgi:multimeric flavodoxin WrbA
MQHYKQPIPQQKVLCVGGSPRNKGNSDAIIEHIQKGLRVAMMENSTVHLRNLSYGSCIGCERCRKEKCCAGVKDDMQAVHKALIEAQGLVLVSPAHNYNITALMKAFIDRLYAFYNFGNDHPRSWSSQLSGQHRKAVIVAVGEQVHKEDLGFTLDGMRLPVEALGYELVGSLEIYGKFERGKVREDPSILRELEALGEKLARAL